MSNILILYSTSDGHTLEICRRLQQVLEQQSNAVSLVSIADAPEVDPESFDQIIIGASIRYGRHSPAIVDFINRHVKVLEAKPSAFFSVNLVARKPEKRQADTNPYLKKFLRRISWQPKTLAVFAGKLDYPSYTVFDRAVIRLIMWVTGGPTDPTTVVDFTDWQQVDDFGRKLTKDADGLTET
jgi:menaquinone-dependent protoporphyrinogen oxidase